MRHDAGCKVKLSLNAIVQIIILEEAMGGQVYKSFYKFI